MNTNLNLLLLLFLEYVRLGWGGGFQKSVGSYRFMKNMGGWKMVEFIIAGTNLDF